MEKVPDGLDHEELPRSSTKSLNAQRIVRTSGRNLRYRRSALSAWLDLSTENAEYHAAKERQGQIESRIAEIEDTQPARAPWIIDVSRLSGSQVKFGATVSVVDEDTEEQAHLRRSSASMQARRCFPARSPSASRRSPAPPIGKEISDVVEVNTLGGVKAYEILKVEWV